MNRKYMSFLTLEMIDKPPVYDGKESFASFMSKIKSYELYIKDQKYNKILTLIKEWLKPYRKFIKSLLDFKSIPKSLVLSNDVHNTEIIKKISNLYTEFGISSTSNSSESDEKNSDDDDEECERCDTTDDSDNEENNDEIQYIYYRGKHRIVAKINTNQIIELLRPLLQLIEYKLVSYNDKTDTYYSIKIDYGKN